MSEGFNIQNISIPNPGSDEAIERNCTCPVMDNHYGKGIYFEGKYIFWYDSGCELHNPKQGDENVQKNIPLR